MSTVHHVEIRYESPWYYIYIDGEKVDRGYAYRGDSESWSRYWLGILREWEQSNLNLAEPHRYVWKGDNK